MKRAGISIRCPWLWSHRQKLSLSLKQQAIELAKLKEATKKSSLLRHTPRLRKGGGGEVTHDELPEVNFGSDEELRQHSSMGICPLKRKIYIYLAFLEQNRGVFAWTYLKMPGLDRTITIHRLMIEPDQRPVKQASRHDASWPHSRGLRWGR